VGIYGVDDYNTYDFNPLISKGSFTFYNGGYDAEEAQARVIDLMRLGKLRPEPYFTGDCTFTLDRIMDGFEAAWQRKTVKSLILIDSTLR